MSTKVTALLAAVALASCGMALRVSAADPELKAGLKQLFDVGWKNSFQALKPAEKKFDELVEEGNDDPRLVYAFALVQMKHRKYERAKELLTDLVASSPTDLHARRGLIWNLMITKKYEAALTEMGELFERLPPADDADGEEAGLVSATFLGRMFGYLEGPGAAISSMPEDTILAERERVANALPTARREAFDAAREAVLTKHEELSLTHEDVKAKAKEEEEKDKERTGERLEAEKEVIAAEKANIDVEAKQAEDKANQQLGDLSKQAATVNTKLAKVNAAGQVVLANLNAVQADMDRAALAARTSKDPIQRDRAARDLARLRPVAGNYEMQYAALDAEAAALNVQLAQIEEAATQARLEYEGEMKRLGRTANKLRKTEKRIGQDEKKLDKPAKGNTAAARAKAAEATAFSSYETYPLEKEKQRLLDAVK